MGNPGQANYVASKAGLIGLTKALAQEMGSRNITVNAVAPGFIETDMTAEIVQELKDNLVGHIALKRIGRPEDVAAAVRFLASEEAQLHHRARAERERRAVYVTRFSGNITFV